MCCTILANAEVGKPEYTPCRNACMSGCKVYDIRPQSCRSYHCEWALGWGDEEDRPDKLGVMFEYYPVADSDGSTLIRSFELTPGAMFTERAERRRAACVAEYNATEVAFLLDDNGNALWSPLAMAREQNLTKPSGLSINGESLDEPEEIETAQVIS